MGEQPDFTTYYDVHMLNGYVCSLLIAVPVVAFCIIAFAILRRRVPKK